MDRASVNRDNNQYSLSIRFSSDGFSLSVHDELNNLLSTKKVATLLFSHTEEEIIRKLLYEPELQVSCKNIRLICELDTYAFVPITLFDEQYSDSFLFYHDKKEKNEKVIFNRLSEWDMVNVFSIPPALYGALNHLYPDLIVEHHLSNFFSSKVNVNLSQTVQIWVRPTKMDVMVFTNGRPVLMNTFPYKSTEDFIYYTLHVFEQLSLNVETYEVKLYNTNKSTDLQLNLQRFIKSVKCCQ